MAGEICISLDSSSSGEEGASPNSKSPPSKVRKFVPVSEIASVLTKNSIKDLFRTHHVSGVSFRVPSPTERVNDPPSGYTGFYTRILELGIRPPFHRFFVQVLNSYGIAPAQLTPFAWCHMLGMLLLWRSLGFEDPSVDEWHHVYKMSAVKHRPNSFFFTRWPEPKGLPILITNLPSSSGPWRSKFVFIEVPAAGQGLGRKFSSHREISRPRLSGREAAQVKAAYAVADRSFKNVVRMGKSKDKLKRKNVGTCEVEASKKQKISSATCNLSEGKDVAPSSENMKAFRNELMRAIVDSTRARPSESVKHFVDKVMKAVVDSKRAAPDSPPASKYEIAFKLSAQALFALFEAFQEVKAAEEQKKKRERSFEVDRLMLQVMKGERVDVEGVINAPGFAELKECLQQLAAEEVLERLKEVHPEYDLSCFEEMQTTP